jgi:hypothetical protein
VQSYDAFRPCRKCKLFFVILSDARTSEGTKRESKASMSPFPLNLIFAPFSHSLSPFNALNGLLCINLEANQLGKLVA